MRLATRLITAAACLAVSGLAFTVPFFEQLPIKNVVPFVLQMLLGWAFLFAAAYQLVQGLREWLVWRTTKGK